MLQTTSGMGRGQECLLNIFFVWKKLPCAAFFLNLGVRCVRPQWFGYVDLPCQFNWQDVLPTADLQCSLATLLIRCLK